MLSLSLVAVMKNKVKNKVIIKLLRVFYLRVNV